MTRNKSYHASHLSLKKEWLIEMVLVFLLSSASWLCIFRTIQRQHFYMEAFTALMSTHLVELCGGGALLGVIT